jgi:flagellar biosynthesis protein FlhF
MILDAPVRLVRTAQELQEALKAFSDKSLILIDTAGMSQRDLRLSQQFALLNDRPHPQLLGAGRQRPARGVAGNDDGLRRVPLSGAILTKVDETTRLGAACSRPCTNRPYPWPTFATASGCRKISRRLRSMR